MALRHGEDLKAVHMWGRVKFQPPPGGGLGLRDSRVSRLPILSLNKETKAWGSPGLKKMGDGELILHCTQSPIHFDSRR